MSEIFLNILKEMNAERIVITAFVLVIAYLAIQIRPYVIKVFENEAKYIESKVKNSEYEYVFKLAKDVWNKVDEDYRIEASITEKFKSKSDYFDSILIQKIPGLRKQDLDFIRQAVAGKVNCEDIPTFLESGTTLLTKQDGDSNENN